MKNLAYKFWITPIFLLSLTSHAAVFGTDDRQEVVQDPRALQLSLATAVMVSPDMYEKDAQGKLTLNFITLADDHGVCPDERFASQPEPMIACTGFLVAPDLLVTAGHCTTNLNEVTKENNGYCQNFDWLFDYRVGADGKIQLDGVDPSRVYHCKQIMKTLFTYNSDTQGHDTYSQDFSVIQLDRPVTDRQPLKLASKPLKTGDPVMMIGYPDGLPAKSAGNASVSDASDPNFYRTNLDAFEGNSGSPVFNADGEVEGILVRSFPDDDYVTDPKESCNRPNVCDPTTGHCGSESPGYVDASEVQRIDAVLPYLAE